MFLGAEDDSGGIQENDVLVELDLLHDLGDAGGVAGGRGPLALHGVDQGALADVREAHDAHDDLLLGLVTRLVLDARVVLQDVHKVVRTHGLRGLKHL